MPPLDAIRRLTRDAFVPLESSDELALAVGATSPHAVRPLPELYSGASGYGRLPSTPLGLLQALGRVTAGPLTPDCELLVFAGSWAILHYLWAFDDPDPLSQDLRTHVVTGRVRHHRRQLLSEDFGIAVAAHALAENLWSVGHPPRLVDADMVLDDLSASGAVVHLGPRRPDYLGLLKTDNGMTLIVLECKGCSNSRATSVAQLRDGVEQALSVRAVGMPTRHFIVGSVVTRDDWRVFAHAVEAAPHPPILPSGSPPAFDEIDEIFRRADDTRLLRLIGAHADATRRLGREGAEGVESDELRLGGELYKGTVLSAPASDGRATLALGLRESQFAAARSARPRTVDPSLVERARMSGEEADWLFRGSEEPLPPRFTTEQWAHAGRVRSRPQVLEERRARGLHPISWTLVEGTHSVVETLDGVRIEVSPTDSEDASMAPAREI